MRETRILVTLSAIALLCLATVAPVADAMYVGFVVGGGKVSISYKVVIHLTGVPENVIDFYKRIVSIYDLIGPTIDYHLQHMLEDYLRQNTSLSNARVEYLHVSLHIKDQYKTYSITPSNVDVDLGTVEEGAVERLATPDDLCMVISSTYYNNSNMVVVYLYFPIKAWQVPTNVKYINITIRGYLSRLLEGGEGEASIAVYNYDTGQYDVIRQQALNTDTPTTISLPLGSATSYVKGRTVIVRIRVVDYGTTPLKLYLDYAKVDYNYYESDFEVNLALTVSGISTWSLLSGRIYNLKFRYMAPILRIDTPYGITILVNTALFLNWTCFKVPLADYDVKFNGTHTIFRLRIENITLPTIGGWRAWVDPEQEIVALGYARPISYDEIAVYEPWMLGVGAVIALVLAIGVLKAIARAIAVVEDVNRSRRRFVARKP